MLVAFITQYKKRFGVEPVCVVLTDVGLRIASSTYDAVVAWRPSARAVRDEGLKKEMKRVYEESYSV